MKTTTIQLLLLMASLLAGCSMMGPIDTSLGNNRPLVVQQPPAQSAAAASDRKPAEGDQAEVQKTKFFKAPTTPSSVARTAPVEKKVTADASLVSDEIISAVTLDGLPLPQFINTIYATILKRNVSIDPAVQTRADLVSLRTGKPQTASQLSAAASSVLRSYGLTVNEFDGLVRVVPSGGMGGAAPEILRGRALPDVPNALRPVFYLVELDNTSQANAVNWVRTIFQGRVTVTEDPPRNAIMLSGQSDSVMAAVDVVRTLDKPALRGRYSARIAPVFWSAADMASRLVEVLTAQGYSAGVNAMGSTPIVVMPVPQVNSVVVFSVSEEALNHTLRWARELDQNQMARSGGRYITYYVRNTDAAEVAKTLQDVLGGTTSTTTPAAASGAAGGAAQATRTVGNSKVVVNGAANSIIIQSTPTEYQQIYNLLQELDRPARSALIMATVAEVSLAENEQFGFNWLLSQFNSGGYLVNGGMGPKPAGTATSASGLALNIASVAGDPRALLTALATSSKVRVLSNPSIVAISGQQASIQVGEDVPILTSQISNSNTGTGTGQGVLQTVQYRNVGIILRVKPTIRAGGRVDLEIGQEVSGVSNTSTGLGNSPVVNTRKVETRLSTADGNTMLIGGLIREQRDGSNAGIPYLKDIPVLGGLFRTSGSSTVARTELVVLITPYVMETDFDSQALTEAFRNQFVWGSEVPFASKPSKNHGDTSGNTPMGENPVKPVQASTPYVVPEAPVHEEQPPATSAGTAQTLEPVATSTPQHQASAGVESGTQPPINEKLEPTKPTASTAPTSVVAPSTPGVGKPIGDEKLKQELLDLVRGVKK